MSREVTVVVSDIPYTLARLLYESSQNDERSAIHRKVHVEPMDDTFTNYYVVATDLHRMVVMIVQKEVINLWGIAGHSDYEWLISPSTDRVVLVPQENKFPTFKTVMNDYQKGEEIGSFKLGTIYHKVESVAPLSIDLRKMPRNPRDTEWTMYSTVFKDKTRELAGCTLLMCKYKPDDNWRFGDIKIAYYLMGMTRDKKVSVVSSGDLV